MGKAKNKKDKKDPEQCFLDALHWVGEKPKLEKRADGTYATGKFGIPSVGIKCAMVEAARQLDGLKMTFLRGAFHVLPLGGLAEIEGQPKMREDMVRNANGNADIRFRPEFWPWSMKLLIRYNISVITPAQLAHLLNTAGFAGGLGEYRPERNGDWGMFHVASTDGTEIARG